jgi:hypothetical protein
VPHPFRNARQPVFPSQFAQQDKYQQDKYQDVNQAVTYATWVATVFQARQIIIQAAQIHQEPWNLTLILRTDNIDIKLGWATIHDGLPPSDRCV